VHNYFTKVNRRPASASGSLGAADFFVRPRVKHAKVFFASMVEIPILSAFLHLIETGDEIFRTAERLYAARWRRTRLADDNAVGGGAYTQN
jgi:hypothetical protein